MVLIYNGEDYQALPTVAMLFSHLPAGNVILFSFTYIQQRPMFHSLSNAMNIITVKNGYYQKLDFYRFPLISLAYFKANLSLNT